MFTSYVFVIIAMVFIAFIFWNIMGSELDKLSSYLYRESAKETYDQIKFLRNFVMIAYGVLIVEFILKLIQIKGNWLTVTEEGISGEACPKFGFGTVFLQEKYSRLYSVEMKRGALQIQTLGGKHYFYVENADRAHAQIYRLMHSEKDKINKRWGD